MKLDYNKYYYPDWAVYNTVCVNIRYLCMHLPLQPAFQGVAAGEAAGEAAPVVSYKTPAGVAGCTNTFTLKNTATGKHKCNKV